MADIRIKDLTTEAPASVTSDFLPIDGNTGTRKLSAYSPSFGGNATVGGTLTVTGNTTLSGNLDVASGISTGTAQLQIGNGRTGSGYAYVDLVGDTTYSDYGFRIIRNNGGANTSSELAHRGTGDFALVANDAAPIKFYTNGVTAATIAATTGNTTIHSTTASLGTSSGALVVGNGTQGGLGVGGAIYAGDTIETTSGSNRIVLGATNYIWHYRSGADGQLRLTRGGVRDWDFKGGTNLTIASDGTTVFTLTSTGNATVGGTLTVSGSSSKLTVSNSTANSLLADFASAYAGGAASPYLVVGSYSDPSTSGARIVVDTDYSNNFQAAMRLQTRNASGTLQNALTLAITRNATFAADVAISGTTPSTTTSSGALVVGNGTSGGLGVGGSAFIGGAINMYGEDFNIHNVGYGSWTLRNTAGSAVFDIRNGAGSWLTFPGAASGTVEFKTLATTVKISATTDSTAKNIGALVVSGGVGVEKAIYAGGSLNVASSSTALTSLNSSTSGATGYNQASFTLDSGGTPKTAVLGVQDTGAFVGTNTNHDVTIRTNTTTRVTVSSSDVTIASGVGLKLGNAYAAGAPTATGYIVIKDSTGTSYKIPAVAL